MEREKFKISIIDFMPHYKKVEVGKYNDGSAVCIGDCVKYKNQENWLVSYRYGKIVLKQIGMMAMVSLDGFDKGDFSRVEKTNTFLSGVDWLIIGYVDEPMYDQFNSLLLR